MERADLAHAVREAALLTGTFRLRSGRVSHEYFDKYRFEARPDLLRQIADHMVPLVPAGTDVLAGLEMGGIPVATALSLKTDLAAAFVRKEAKDYGTCRLAEGSEIEGKQLCLVEDVITTGGQVILSTRALRDRGAIVRDVLCVILRDDDALMRLQEAGLVVRPLFTYADLIRNRTAAP